jgi:hypothetical protein
MTEHAHKTNPWYEGIITALSIGGFLIILGSVFGLTPGIPQKIGDFFGDITIVTYPLGNGDIALPAPANPAQHLDLFGAVFNFMVGIAVLQAVILGLRLLLHSRVGKTAESVGDLIFWAGGAAMANMFLLSGTLTGWFTFWASMIIVLGVSLIVRGIIHFAGARRNRSWRQR